MFIWNSFFLMALIDMMIIMSVAYLYRLFYKYRDLTRSLKLEGAIKTILFGLSIIQLFYFLDLLSMFVLPMFTSMEYAMGVMESLHLNWRWLASLVGILGIFWGLSQMFPKIEFNVKKIQSIYQDLEIKNNELEAALVELRKAQVHLEERVQERTRELKETLENLENAHVKLVQTEKMSSLGQMVAGIAHEINNPVNFIHGNLDHLEEYVKDLSSFVQLCQESHLYAIPEIKKKSEEIDLDFLQLDLPRLLNSMKVGTERIHTIILSLRNFARVDEAEFKTVRLCEGLKSTLLMLEHRLKAQSIRPKIRVVFECGNLPPVECYPSQLNQVFMNILANAVDAIDERFYDLNAQAAQALPEQRITIRAEKSGLNWVKIAIADTGVGMSESYQKKVFDPFFTTKEIGKRTGMGMSISYQIITEKHGGRLECSSKQNQGTEFSIEIPIHQ